uniref:Uncharacterized protein n=1 Tax=Arion vulgaris TaxID=1028688 RepID=A0A0B7AEJ1_9EUPU
MAPKKNKNCITQSFSQPWTTNVSKRENTVTEMTFFENPQFIKKRGNQKWYSQVQRWWESSN